MAVGYSIHQILTNGASGALVKAIRVGRLKANELYPVLQINDFAVPEHCKDGYDENYTVTVTVWASTQSEADTVGNSVISDLHHLAHGIYSSTHIRRVTYTNRGPWIEEEDKSYWGRPIDFEVHVTT